jgi:hypothetical protein
MEGDVRGHVDEEGAGDVDVDVREVEGAVLAEGEASAEESAAEGQVGGYPEGLVVAGSC